MTTSPLSSSSSITKECWWWPQPEICNIVATFSCFDQTPTTTTTNITAESKPTLNLIELYEYLKPNAVFNPQRFSALVYKYSAAQLQQQQKKPSKITEENKKRKNKKTRHISALIFASGRVVVCGSQTLHEATKVAFELAKIIRRCWYLSSLANHYPVVVEANDGIDNCNGCRNISTSKTVDDNSIASFLQQKIQSPLPSLVNNNNTQIAVHQFCVRNIVGSFKCSSNINLNLLYEHLKNYTNFLKSAAQQATTTLSPHAATKHPYGYCLFEQETYGALRYYLPRQLMESQQQNQLQRPPISNIVFIVFYTGSIIVSGAKCVAEMELATQVFYFQFLKNFLCTASNY